MKLNEFNEVFSKMCKYYDKRHSDDNGMRDIYYNEMRKIDDRIQLFENILYQRYKYFPKVTEIKEIIDKMNEEKYIAYIKNKNRQVEDCHLCKGSGYRFIIQTINEMPYAFVTACDCHNGDNKLYEGDKHPDPRYRSPYRVRKFSREFPDLKEWENENNR